MADSVKFSLEIDAAAVKAGLAAINSAAKQTDKSFKDVEKSGKTTFDQISVSIGKSIGAYDIFKGNLAANFVTKSFEFIKNSASQFFESAIKGASESEQSIKNLNIALSSAGLNVGETSKRFQDFANTLQKTTVYSDDAVLSSVSLLASLTNLDEQGIKKATEAAADLATTLGIPLQDATEMIQKAVNGNITAFAKNGIIIQKADTDAARLANTLSALSTQQGASSKVTETFSGATIKLNNQQDDLLKALGKLITENPAVIASIKSKTEAFENLAGWVTTNRQFIYDLGKTIAITAGIIAVSAAGYYAASIAIGILGAAAVTGATGFNLLGIAAGIAWAAVTGPVAITIGAITLVGLAVYGVVKYWDQIKIATYEALAATLEFASKATFGDTSSKLKAEAQAWRDKAQAINETTGIETEASSEAIEQAQKRIQKLREESDEVLRTNEAKAELGRIHNEELLLIEQEKNDALTVIKDGYDADDLAKRQQHETAKLELQIAADTAKAKLEKDSYTRTENLKKIQDKAELDRARLSSKQDIELARQKVENQKSTFSTIATLSSSNNKTLAGIGKAAGITQIAIDTPVAISKSLAAFPYPFNIVAAALTGAAMAAQAARIAGVNFASGGIVPGTSFTGDKVSAGLNSGEMVLNKSQQSQLFELANGRGETTSDNSRVEFLLERLVLATESGKSININGKEIVNVVRDEIQSGRRI
jgi:hypothetical protein